MIYITNVEPIISDMRSLLAERYGTGLASVADVGAITKGALLAVLNHEDGADKFISNALLEFTVPKDKAELCASRCIEHFHNTCLSAIMLANRINCIADVFVISDVDAFIIIEEITAPPPSEMMLDYEHFVINSIRESMDNGDFVPEKLRRLVERVR